MFTNRFALVVQIINFDTLMLRLTEREDHKQRVSSYLVSGELPWAHGNAISRICLASLP
jgi:hypothetical protein